MNVIQNRDHDGITLDAFAGYCIAISIVTVFGLLMWEFIAMLANAMPLWLSELIVGLVILAICAWAIDTWACQLVCRTGSADTNTKICMAANGRGLKWQPYGLGFEDLRTGKQMARCRTEQEVFGGTGLQYVEPWER